MDNTLTPEKFAYIKALIEYRSSLSNGRRKPDRTNNNPYIQDSGEYINLISQLDIIITEELGIHDKYINAKRIDNVRSREEFLFKSVPNLDD